MLSRKAETSNRIHYFWIGFTIALMFFLIWAASGPLLHSSRETRKPVSKPVSLMEFAAGLDKRIPALMKAYNIPGVTIALVQKGRTTWTQAYGYADCQTGRKMTTDTYCRVESISKSVTAWGVMKLARQGKIELDKPVMHYLGNWRLPESPFSEEKVTVRRLLTHTAGMPLGDFMDRYSPAGRIPSLKLHLSKAAVLMQEPGRSFSYSNTGYNLLELIIEEVTGRDFAEYMKQEVLIPLGMRHSSFEWSESLQPAVPVGYGIKGNSIPVYVYPAKASGGLFAPVEDIAAFVAAGMTRYSQKGHNVLPTETIHELYAPTVGKVGVYSLVFNSYGMGHYLEDLPNGMSAVVNGGQGGGVMTLFEFVPETGDGIVVLTNSQRSWPFFGYVMTDWAKWRGFEAVGMGRIIGAQKGLWGLIGTIGLIVLWQVWRLGQGLVSGRRCFAPLAKKSRTLRLVQGGIAVLLVLGLVWCMNQDYLFISSVFPIAADWLGLALFGLAAVFGGVALFPRIETGH